MRVRRFLLLGLIACCACMVGWAATTAAAERPNILVILVDDLGWGDLSIQGADDLRTPHIDRLIAGGMRFENAYANCPVCSPTRASLLTGRYPELVGVPGVIRTHAENSWGYLAPEAVLLPSLLKRAGYHTAIVGKWHLGLESPSRPNERGFDHFHGFLGDMMDDYYHHRRHDVNYMRWNTEEIHPQGHATDLFSEWAEDYIRGRAAAPEPFFLYLAYNAPHTPIQPPPDWLERVRRREPAIDENRAKLVALIEHLDDGVGRVLAALEQTGQAERTLVIFSSDNGGQLNVGANNGPFRDGKQSMYEGGLRVAQGARWPGRIEAGSTTPRRVASIDIFATVCEAAGAEVAHRIDGQSFLPTLLGEEQPAPDRDLFFHRREGGLRYGGLTTSAVIRGDWKLLQDSPYEPLRLFNLAEDPAETTDRAASAPRVFGALAAALRLHVQRGGAVPWQPPTRRDAE